MNCTRIALYDITSGTYDEIVEQAKMGMTPLFEQSPGFVSYSVAQIDKNAFVSVSTWRNRQQADAATTKAATWVKEDGLDHFALREHYTGDLAIDVHVGETAGLVR